MKTINILYTVAIMVIVSACQNNPLTSHTANSPAAIVEKPVNPTWFFKTKMDEYESPQTQIFMILKDTVKVADATASFRELSKEEYADKELPKETLTACWGFWAGLEQQYILIDSSQTWVIKRKLIDEGSDGKDVFETVISIKK